MAISFKSPGSSLKLFCLHQIFSTFPQEVTAFSANPPPPRQLAGRRGLNLLSYRASLYCFLLPNVQHRLTESVHTLTAFLTLAPSQRLANRALPPREKPLHKADFISNSIVGLLLKGILCQISFQGNKPPWICALP